MKGLGKILRKANCRKNMLSFVRGVSWGWGEELNLIYPNIAQRA